jgi:hypothetical protein
LNRIDRKRIIGIYCGRLESADEELSRRIKRVTGDEMMQRWNFGMDMGRRKLRYRPSYLKREGTTGSTADGWQCFGVEDKEGATKTS